jgi:hypothetical protein
MPLVDPGSAVFAAFGHQPWHVEPTNQRPSYLILRKERNQIDDEDREATMV